MQTSSNRRFSSNCRIDECWICAVRFLLCTAVVMTLFWFNYPELFFSGNTVQLDPVVEHSLLHGPNPDVEKSFVSGSRKDVKGKKWIVVTSIQSPTEDVKKLASQSTDWTVVVVADKKTPRRWSLPGVHFLSVEGQAAFGNFSQLLPFASYTRKNLGYLYAMANGAEWIYDTDDDNKPYGKGLEQFDYGETVSGLRYTAKAQNISGKLFNPYQFFGYSKMWPRGFPLEYLRGHTNGDDRMILCRRMRTAAVQQGIVHNDPDVDAIYRLFNADSSGLHVTFDKFAPPIVLEEGTYSPWNSQNTLFHKRAFFTMFLPTTVAFRVTDIWRSYFAQKLLHLIGEQVAFYPVNAVQFRNAHNYLSDFDQEIEVYQKSGKIVQFLDQWNCSQGTIDRCMLQLAREFSKRGFFGDRDFQLIEAWLNALKELNYTFPPLVKSTKSIPEWRKRTKYGNCREANLNLGVQNYDSKKPMREERIRAQTAVERYEEILDWCSVSDNKTYEMLPLPEDFSKFLLNGTLAERKDTVLILLNNYPWKSSMGMLQRLYSPFFAMTIFCGTWDPHLFQKDSLPLITPVSYINLTVEEMRDGHGYHYCFSKVRDLRLQNVKGYLFVADDSIFNFWRPFPTKKIYNPHPVDDSCAHWDSGAGKKMAELLRTTFKNDAVVQETLSTMMKKLPSNQNFTSAADYLGNCTGKAAADLIYIPAEDPTLDYVANLVEIQITAGIHVEHAMGKILRALDFEKKDFKYDWSYNKDRGSRYKDYMKSRLGLHPLKLSLVEKDLAFRGQFCNTVISTFVRGIFRAEKSS